MGVKMSELFPEDYFSLDTKGLLKQYAVITHDIKVAFELGKEFVIPSSDIKPDHIFLLGMGGSAFAFDLLKLFLEDKGLSIPITIVRSYTMPSTFTEKSLVLVNTYSGNTEEVVSASRQAFRKTANIFSISSGGKLKDICNLNRTPHLTVPQGFAPRTAAITHMFFPWINLLARLGIIENQQTNIFQLTKNIVKPDYKTLSIGLSEKLLNRIPMIYASSQMYPLAKRFKTQINENAKVHAFANHYSELDHNELLGYTHLVADYHIITFKFNSDHRRIQKRMELTKEVTNAKGVATTEIALTGDHFLTKMFSAVLIGDLTSYYLALRYGKDPSPVELIEELKKSMGPTI